MSLHTIQPCSSCSVSAESGTCQGGILCPILRNIYVNSLNAAMQSSDLGCHLGDEYRGCIAYADDIISLSTSLINLQKGLIRVLMVHRLHGQRVLNTLV